MSTTIWHQAGDWLVIMTSEMKLLLHGLDQDAFAHFEAIVILICYLFYFYDILI
jgi:hypothetical protein